MKKLVIRNYFSSKVLKTRKLNKKCQFNSFRYDFEDGYIVFRHFFSGRILSKIKAPDCSIVFDVEEYD